MSTTRRGKSERLVTGQNPAPTTGMAEAVVALVENRSLD
jgi:hypothetical protein